MFKSEFSKFFPLALILSFNASYLFCQSIESVISKNTKDLSIKYLDRSANAFLSSKEGDVHKMDLNGKILLTYSPSKISAVKQIDLWSNYKIMVFYEGLQEIVMLNRFLTEVSRIDLNEFNLGYVSNTTLNFQQHLWLVDESDFSLKLIDPNTREILINQPFFQFLDVDKHEIIYIKENKGRLYILDRFSGLLIFDLLGNLVSKIEESGIKSMGFVGNDVYYFNEGMLIVENLFSGEKFNINLPQSDYDDVQFDGKYLICTSSDRLDIYKYIDSK